MRVLLTGASGFTGLYLGEHLERLGMQVLRATNEALPGRSGWVGMDLEDHRIY